MNLSSLSEGLSVGCQTLSFLLHEMGQVFGHIWKTIYQIPSQLYQLVLAISAVSKAFFSDVKPGIGCNVSLKPCSKNKENHLIERVIDFEDLFNAQPIDSAPQLILNTQKDGTSCSDILCSGEEMTSQLDQQIDDLKKRNAGDESSSVAEITQEILKIVYQIVQPSRLLMKEIALNKPANLLNYLDLTERLEQELEPLRKYISKFKEFPESHCLIHKVLNALEDKVRELRMEMCAQVKIQYKPNPKILSDGHCLFWSIENQLKEQNGPLYYRKLAADFIREFPQEFQGGISDVIKSKNSKAKVVKYIRMQGGKRAWLEKLEKQLGKKPTEIDCYCDCLENSFLWGGANEILALSEKLKAPILVFTRQNPSTWRFDIMKGVSKFKDTPPILIYYNGFDHYQDLIPNEPDFIRHLA